MTVLKALIAEYPGTEFLGKLVAREFAIAVRWLSKDHASALKTLQRIRFHHPDSPLATSALIEIAVHYLKLKNEAEAKLYYEQLISDHPEGSWLIDLFRLQQLQRTARQEQLEAARAVNPGGQAEKVGRGEQNPPVPDASFDDWAFAAKPGADRFHDQVDVLLKNKLEGLLTRKVDEVEQMFLLTAAQRQKLRLAGHGDIKRLLDSVEEARREFDLAKQDVDRLSEVRNKLRTVDLLMTSGPFDFGSLFHKTLRKMFDEKQLKRRSTRVKTTSVGGMMCGMNIIRVVLAVFLVMAPRLLLSQDSGAKPSSSADRPASPIGHARVEKAGEPQVATLPREQIFERLEAAPDAPPVDVVRLHLFRMRFGDGFAWPASPTRTRLMIGPSEASKAKSVLREQLDNLLQCKLQVVDHVFQLTDPQRRKLHLAGRGDIKHLLELVNDSRREFGRACLDVRRLPDLQKQLRLVELRISNGPFEAGSILAKTLRKMYDAKELNRRGQQSPFSEEVIPCAGFATTSP